jgi:hypothetical protein
VLRGLSIFLILFGALLTLTACDGGQPQIPTPPPAPVDQIIFMGNH